jgi:hypothetical protein
MTTVEHFAPTAEIRRAISGRELEYPPPMIAAFGIPDEPEPGVMFLPNASIRGMHLTRLAPDGSDRDRGERAKIIIGTWPAAHCGGAHG